MTEHRCVRSLLMCESFSRLLLGFVSFLAFTSFALGDTNTHGYAWSENAGWHNFAPADGGVTLHINEGFLSGFVWSENIGWIKMGHDDGGPYVNDGTNNWGVNIASNSNLSGYAWSENCGWINFNPEHSQVTVNMADGGSWNGYAWSENIGWIHFKHADPEYNVLTSVKSMQVLGTNNVVVESGDPASQAEGTDFGDVPRGLAATHTLSITNNGSMALNISGWSTNGTGAAAFEITGIPSDVDPGAASDFNVTFRPENLGAYSAELNIVSDSIITNYVINLHGNGVGRPMLTVSTNLLKHSIITGQDMAGEEDVIVLGNIAGANDLNFVASVEVDRSFMMGSWGDWMQVSDESGTIAADGTVDLTVTYDTSDLRAYVDVIIIYRGTITITAINTATGDPALGSPQVIDVSIVVAPLPRVDVNKASLNNEISKGYDAPVQRFDVWNGTRSGLMKFNITENIPWLITSISSGTSTGQRHTVEVMYSTTGLEPGIHRGTITITGEEQNLGFEASNSPKEMLVELHVHPIASLVINNASGLTQAVRKGRAVSSGSFDIYNGSSYPQGVLGYEIVCSEDWLSVDNDEGIVEAEQVKEITVSYNAGHLPPGLHNAFIVVSGVDVGTEFDAINSPVIIPVKLLIERVNYLDFSGNGMSDLVLYHQSSGEWHVLSEDGEYWVERFGGSSYTPVPGDYSGDGVFDLGVYRPFSAYWYSKPLGSDKIRVIGNFGGYDYKPVRGDFDGDGRQDFALYCTRTGAWYVMTPDGTVLGWGFVWGGPEFMPLAGDFSGDGVDDLAVYAESTGEWYIITAEGILLVWGDAWGGPGFEPLIGDYNGDGFSDVAVYHRSSGRWYIASLTEGIIAWGIPWGGDGFIPLAGDYNGDGRTDLAVYHNGLWYIITVDGTVIKYGVEWGGPGYTPIGM